MSYFVLSRTFALKTAEMSTPPDPPASAVNPYPWEYVDIPPAGVRAACDGRPRAPVAGYVGIAQRPAPYVRPECFRIPHHAGKGWPIVMQPYRYRPPGRIADPDGNKTMWRVNWQRGTGVRSGLALRQSGTPLVVNANLAGSRADPLRICPRRGFPSPSVNSLLLVRRRLGRDGGLGEGKPRRNRRPATSIVGVRGQSPWTVIRCG